MFIELMKKSSKRLKRKLFSSRITNNKTQKYFLNNHILNIKLTFRDFNDVFFYFLTIIFCLLLQYENISEIFRLIKETSKSNLLKILLKKIAIYYLNLH